MEQKNKNALIGGLLAIVFVMAVGYAAFATTLTINGTANITSRWDVHIKDIKVSEEENNPAGTGISVSAQKDGELTANFEAQLKAPGDSVTYDVTVENTGTLPAKLSDITFKQTNNGDGATEEGEEVTNNGTSYDGDNAIVYSYAGITTGTVLEANTGSVTFKVTVKYNDKITTQPEDKQLKSNLKMTLTYVQDMGN